MADQATSLQEILARLGAAQSAQPPPPGGAMPSYPPAQQSYPPPAGAPPYGAPPGAYPYPQPSASGSVDLSKVAPYQSGVMPAPGTAAPSASSIQEAIARARSFAADHGATPYERPPGYGGDRPGSGGPARYGRSRSRSPSRRDGGSRENFNSYRDDRGRDGGFGARGGSGDRDRSFSPRGGRRAGGNMFSPRGGNGGARERSPLRGDDNSETMQIEGSLVGLIIGRQGENLRRIENDTQCRVQFLPASASDGDHRLCKITGPPPRRAEARAAINRIIDDSGMTPLNRAGFDRGGRDRGGAGAMVEPKEGEECLQIMVPDRTVGLIIGRGGETIRDLQERSGCHINIVGESKSVNGLRPVNLIGTHETSMKAKNLIMEIVESDTRNGGQGGPGGPGGPPHGGPRGHRGDHGGGMGGGGGDRINDSIYVPSEAVGMIIGKGGETIREMQSNTGCKINVSQSSGPNETEREIGLVGSRDSIERAKRAIEDKVDTVRQKNSGGGGGGGFRGGRGAHRDYDNPNYSQPSNHSASQSQQQPPAAQGQPVPAAPGGADPYAAYGGYQAYAALWFQAMAQAQQAGGQPADGDKKNPPGTS